MSDQRGTATGKGGPRSAPLAVGLVIVIGVIVAAVIAALTQHGSSPQGPPIGVPTSARPGPSVPAEGSQSAAAPLPSAAPKTTSADLVPGRTLSGAAGVDTAEVAAFGAWRGKPLDVVVDYVGTKTWDGVTQLNREGLLDRGLPSTVHRVFSVPLIPTDDNATLAEGATGAYDQHFKDLADELIKGGQANATIRLGWEMTGNWFGWNGVKDPASFVGAFQKAVTAMRSVNGAAFTFDWTVALGQVDPEPMYPGDAYVDLIGADNYDISFSNTFQPTDHEQVWAGILSESWGLNWLGDFASSHGKRISIGEWGLSDRADGHGGGDDPYFIEQMHDWITQHDVAYEAYFESVDPSIAATFAIDNGHFPQAAQRYRELFGSTG